MNRILLFLILCYTSVALAQVSQPLIIDLPKDTRVQQIISLKDKGAFIVSGKDEISNSKEKNQDLDVRLKYVNADLQLKWDKPFPLEPNNQGDGYKVASCDSFIYFIETLGGTLTKSNFLITQIDYSGITRIYEYNVPWKIEKLHSYTCDKGNLFFFYDDMKDSKKPYHLISFSHKDFRTSSADFTLPKLPKKKEELNSERWICMGQHNDQFYFYSKQAKSSNNCVYNISIVNNKGDVTGKFFLQTQLDSNLYIAPTNNPHIGHSWTDSDFNFLNIGENNFPSAGALGDIYFDFEEQSIYLFGNYNTAPLDNTGAIGSITGLFINKFDLKGNLIWKKIMPFNKEMKDPLFRSSFYIDRLTNFTIDPVNGNILFDLGFMSNKKSYTFFFNKEGVFQKWNASEIGSIPEVICGKSNTPQTYHGGNTPVYKKPNRYTEEDTPAMKKMEELSKLSLKKVPATKLKNPGMAKYSTLFFLARNKKEDMLFESNFGEGKIKIYNCTR